VIETYRRNVPEQVEHNMEDRELTDREERLVRFNNSNLVPKLTIMYFLYNSEVVVK